jgi:cytochrome c-type biogenesis protein CcmH/NrfF
MTRLALALLASVVAFTSLPAMAAAQDGARAVSIYRNTQSPFCPGRTLDDCPSPDAATWRADIRRWVDEGASGAEIRARLQDRVPGFDLSGRAGVPGLGFAIGAFTLVALALGARFVVRRRRRSDPTIEPDADPTRDEELDARLDDELARRLG